LLHRYKVMTLTPSVRAMCRFAVFLASPDHLPALASSRFPPSNAFSFWPQQLAFDPPHVATNFHCDQVVPNASYYQPAINMINMRVGGYVVPRITCPKLYAPRNRARCRRELCWNLLTRSPAFREYRVRRRGQSVDRLVVWRRGSANRQPCAC
jgi:hypothetical protein